MTTNLHIAVIGAGFSGTLAAAHLVRAGARATLIDPAPHPGRGLAYATRCPSHLLNVPAARMSAFGDAPDHFRDWASARLDQHITPTEFLSRELFGDYLESILRDAASEALTVVNAEAVDLVISGSGVSVSLAAPNGEPIRADGAILALGNAPPADPPLESGAEHLRPPHYTREPWAPGALTDLAPDAPVLCIGTGLTMIDVVLALRDAGHTGPITAISRRGRTPWWHTPSHIASPSHIPPIQLGDSPRSALRALRAAAATAPNPRDAVDAIRAITPAIWGSWSTARRASFCRHARPYWDVARHRTAPEVGARINALVADGDLAIHAARLLSVKPTSAGLACEIRRRGHEASHAFTAARVINCTGPCSDVTRHPSTLVHRLLERGTIVPDALRLGVRTDDDARPITRTGEPAPSIRVVGSWRAADLWESVAVPELRVQAEGAVRSVLTPQRQPHATAGTARRPG